MSTLPIEQRLTELWERPKTVRGWFATVDHKELGIRYVVTAFVFLLVGGLEALLMRIQCPARIRPCSRRRATIRSYHAWHHHDLLVCRANPFRLRRLSWFH